MTRASRIQMTAVAFLVTAVSLSCTDAFIEPTRAESTHVDNRLALKGRVCTSVPDPNGFPVKVVFVVDQSGSMCVSDPPGSQGGAGFCEQEAVKAIVPPGVTQPARVRALHALLNQFKDQPNVRVAVVPFHTNIAKTWPDPDTGFRFARPNATVGGRTVTNFVNDLQGSLGKGTDYQGAIARATELIETDINDTVTTNPALLPRTRYVVVFLSDGTPYPRCAGNDNLSPDRYASPDDPARIWRDTEGAEEFCNLLDTEGREGVFPPWDKDTGEGDDIVGFQPGADRNQNEQIFTYVDRLMQLRRQNNVGDIRLHTVLLFNQAAVQACSTPCQELYGKFPGVAPADYPREAKKVAAWTLKQMATLGNGMYQEFNNGDISQMSLGALDYSSLASPYVMRTLLVQNLRSTPGADGPKVDSDGDGLADDVDNAFTFDTSAKLADSDNDCFDDRFETLHASEGFVAGNQRDSRGCDGTKLDCSCDDTDGDGLSLYAEQYLKSRPGMVDSDGDGIPDGLEARYGFDLNARAEPGIDTDGDGIPDLEEIRAGSDPTRQDRAYFERFGHQYEVRAEKQDDGSTCYDFTVSNLHLVTPPNGSGVQQGFNLFKVYFAEAPASGIGTDYGRWKAACAWAQYDPPSVRAPAGPDLTVPNEKFKEPQDLIRPDQYVTECVGIPPR